ncbi:putative quinol monooxygenase [Brevibacterium aurantiacum]|uniref:ABM domain-containing protein n=1 Tax=Brevibacterium aurantiacum TaxID=273384 RepID=A0A2A3ZA56_BREAU|nr:putative quinol monooxygenase [Brevibacterium aurantiacum]PCC48419.1 hypothetical protein CIK64_01660 [Brevibacterium aurantiacum]
MVRRDSFDVHAKPLSAIACRSGVGVRTVGGDNVFPGTQREHSEYTWKANGGTMEETIMIIAESHAAPGRADQVRALFESVVDRTRAEDGCLRYELLQDLDNGDRIILVEEWLDQASLDAHLGADHIVTLFQEIMPLLTDSGRMTRVARLA